MYEITTPKIKQAIVKLKCLFLVSYPHFSAPASRHGT